MSLSDNQRGVLKGMAAAVVVTLLAIGGAAWVDPFAGLVADTVQGRLALWAGCSLAVVFWLILSIGALARHRFFHAEDIDGSGLTEGSKAAAIKQAVLQNTLEQGAIAFIVYGAVATFVPYTMLSVLPAAAGLFFIGRLFFRIGYAGGAPSRAFGFALTFYPTVLLFLIAVGVALACLAR